MRIILPHLKESPSDLRDKNASSTWSWPISYSSIEATVCALDALLIIAVSVATGVIYVRLFQVGDLDLTRYVATAVISSALFVPLFRSRGLYDPASLVNW